MIQSFTIPGRLNGLNEYTRACRANRYKGSKMKSEDQEYVGWQIKGARLKPHKGAVKIHYTFYEKPARNGAMRDKSNISGFGVKVIEDALQEHGIIKNDNWEYMDEFWCTFIRVKDNPRIEVEIKDA